MILLKPSVAFESPVTFDLLRLIERAGRTCYKSEAKHEEQVDALVAKGECVDPDVNSWGEIPREEADRKITDHFIRHLIAIGHHSVLEHASVSVRIICDRGVSHELVRHRIAAYSQESTRYVNYSKTGGCQFIIPPWINIQPGEYNGETEEFPTDPGFWTWFSMMHNAEDSYFDLLKKGWSPQQARSVLPYDVPLRQKGDAMTDKPNATAAQRYSLLEWHDASEKPTDGQDCLVCYTEENYGPRFLVTRFSGDIGMWGPFNVGGVRENLYLNQSDATSWAYLHTAQDAVTVDDDVTMCGHCIFFGSFADEDGHNAWCNHPDRNRGFNRHEGIDPDCPLLHKAHLIMLSPDARKRLEGKETT